MGAVEVTTIAPMKRGLKAVKESGISGAINGYNHCPDEKGTERSAKDRVHIPFPDSYNHCPDEKGTERVRLNRRA